MAIEHTNSLGRVASWVVIESKTGKVLFETWNPAIPAKLNTSKYKAVPIAEHLASINRAIRRTDPSDHVFPLSHHSKGTK